MTTKQQDAVDDMGLGPKRPFRPPVTDYGTPPTPATDLGVQDTADLAVARARIAAVVGLAKANANDSSATTLQRRRWRDVLTVLGEP